jgi:hypothetical protein
VNDAREGRPLYFWSIFTDWDHRREIIRDGWKDVGRVFVIAAVIDFIYRIVGLRSFYPSQALIVTVILAILPHLIVRSLLNRMAGRWPRGATAPDEGD